MFDQNDILQIGGKGMLLPSVQKQIDHFIKGFPFINLVRPAVASDGIVVFDDARISGYQKIFEEAMQMVEIVKFVPASGAASRMFKHLFEFVEKYTASKEGDILFSKETGFNSVYHFIHHLAEFAFYKELSEGLSKTGVSIDDLIENKDYGKIIGFLLNPDGMDYANLPKALLLFHDYPAGARTAAEEHLVEAAEYAKDHEGVARIHFTISPEHQQKFLALFSNVKDLYEASLNVKFDISYSTQKPATDTIAVDEANNPVRNESGRLIFRPGGHGALIDNLNDINADIIFVKNIDNNVPDRLKSTTFTYKKVIGGYLISIKRKIDNNLHKLHTGSLSNMDLAEITKFAQEELLLDLPSQFNSITTHEKIRILFELLNRPVRVCGMVKNEGEPGGGPFWVSGKNGRQSLQIVESSQINFQDTQQKGIASNATHFNPVDLVCATKNFQGEKYNLKDFIDEDTGFISLKSSGGKTLKAQELPGLWNGAMANWITLFVEVPIVTFNPVKTVNDLLRNEHRAVL